MPSEECGPSRRREPRNEAVPRPDRAALKGMTAHVDVVTWRFFKKLAPDLNTTQEKLLHGALRLFMSRFKGVPESEKQAVWEAIKKEAAGGS